MNVASLQGVIPVLDQRGRHWVICGHAQLMACTHATVFIADIIINQGGVMGERRQSS